MLAGLRSTTSVLLTLSKEGRHYENGRKRVRTFNPCLSIKESLDQGVVSPEELPVGISG